MGYIFGDNNKTRVIKGKDVLVIPARTFVVALVYSTLATQLVKVGSTLGGSQYFEDTIEGGSPYEHVIDKYFKTATTLYVTGALGSGTVDISAYKI